MKSNTVRTMKRTIVLAAAVGVLTAGAPVQAHDTPGIEHTHPFEKSGYTQPRQTHSVNNQVGDITIMTPPTKGGYQSAPSVRFARPEPITQPPPLTPNMQPHSINGLQPKVINDPSLQYGKKTNKDYGKQ
jgi:hypothetical protein